MIAKRKARRKEPADEEVVVCVPFSLGISNEADEGKIFVIFVVQSICLSLSLLSLKCENAQAHSMVVCGDDVGSSPRLELLSACLLNCSLLRVDG
jgi:hypothetical protein